VNCRVNGIGGGGGKKERKKERKKFKLSFFFLDLQGPVLKHYQERGTTVNSASCNEILTDS
jgi:hypothetical protein